MLSRWGFIVKFFQLFHMLETDQKTDQKNIIKEKDEQMREFAKEMKRARENPEIQRTAG